MAKSQDFSKNIILAFLAGLSIALGGTVFLRLKDAFPGGNVVGAILFSVGLFTVCTKGLALFTGKACYLLNNKPSYIGYLGIVWIGNFIGSVFLAFIESLTSVGAGLKETAVALVGAKMDSTYLSLFILGFICNIFIYIAVSSYANNPHEAGKYIGLIFSVAVFILCGSEHSVADMYYWAMSGILYTNFCESLLRIIIISLGNIVGGVFFCYLESLAKRKE